MMDTDQLVNKLLEKYVFTVADKLINQADQETQSRIVRLILQINTPASTTDNLVSSASITQTKVAPRASHAPMAESYIKGLEDEWQEALRKPISQKRIDAESTMAVYLSQLDQQRITIANLTEKLSRLKTKLAETQSRLTQCMAQNEATIKRLHLLKDRLI